MGEVVLGSLKRTSVAVSKIEAVVTSLIGAPLPLNAAPAGTGYAYGGGLDIPAVIQHGDILRLTLTSEVAVPAGLADVRIEMPGGVRWFSDNADGSLRDRNGKLFSTDVAVGDNTFDISLSKSGLNPLAFGAGKNMHFHLTNNTAVDLALTVKTLAIVRELAPVVVEGLILPDYVKPELAIAVAAPEYRAGDVVTINVTASDNNK